MKTRHVLRWNLSAPDELDVIRLAVGSLILRALEAATACVERWLDRVSDVESE